MRHALTLAVAALLSAPAHAGPTAARFQAERRAAATAVASLGPATTVWPPHRSRPVAIRNIAVPVSGRTDEERARRFIALRPALFGSLVETQLRHVETRATHDLRAVRLQQVYRGVEVDGGMIVVTLDGLGRVRAVSSEAEPVGELRVTPSLAPDTARRIACRGACTPVHSSLVIVRSPLPRLAYRVPLPIGTDLVGRVCFVDAQSGELLGCRQTTFVDGLAPRHGEVRP